MFWPNHLVIYIVIFCSWIEYKWGHKLVFFSCNQNHVAVNLHYIFANLSTIKSRTTVFTLNLCRKIEASHLSEYFATGTAFEANMARASMMVACGAPTTIGASLRLAFWWKKNHSGEETPNNLSFVSINKEQFNLQGDRRF